MSTGTRLGVLFFQIPFDAANDLRGPQRFFADQIDDGQELVGAIQSAANPACGTAAT